MINDMSMNPSAGLRKIHLTTVIPFEDKPTFTYSIFQDWNTNRGNIKGKLVMLAFRIAHLATLSKTVHILMIPYLAFYKVLVLWFLGIEIQHRAKIGRGLFLAHGMGLVVHKAAVIGKNCTLRQCTTIGKKMDASGNTTGAAVIGDNIDIGANVCIIGKIFIGSHSIIGAGSVVVKDVPERVVVAGNPAKIIKHL